MPSTYPDRDSNASTPRDKDENPFIKFKRFADAQIGAVLQGIIGLPSVFSKQLNDANPRWADIRDDLKRRDALLAEQRASKETELKPSCSDSQEEEVEIPVRKFPSWKSNHPAPEDEEVEIPVKRFHAWPLPISTQTEMPKSSSGDNQSGQEDMNDLFSPVTKSLFAHLIRKPVDDVDWGKQGLLPGARCGFHLHGDCRNGWDIWQLRDDQKTGNAMNMIQSMVFNNLNRTAPYADCDQFHGPRSVLPYLLFSPYSPLALSSMPPLTRQQSLFEPQVDEFPYCEAFEDLLLASQGRPMAKWVLVPSGFRVKEDSNVSTGIQNSELRKAESGVAWIEDLHYHGLLSQEPPSAFSLFGQIYPQSPIYMKFVKPQAEAKDPSPTTSKSQEDHETEQDVYDFFDRIVGNVSSPFLLGNAMQAMEAFIRDAVNYIAEQEGNVSGNRSKSSERASSKVFDTHKSTFIQTEKTPGLAAQANATKSVATGRAAEEQLEASTLPASDRVVSTTTSTEQTTDETGGVHTTVRIEKVYADGRVSITETSKKHILPVDMRNAQRVPADDGPGCRHYHVDTDGGIDDSRSSSATPVQRRYMEEDEAHNKKDRKRKGWFWN